MSVYYTGALAYGSSRYGPGMGAVYLDDVGCSGFENHLTDCNIKNFGDVSSNCRSHYEDASVFCPTGILFYSTNVLNIETGNFFPYTYSMS